MNEPDREPSATARRHLDHPTLSTPSDSHGGSSDIVLPYGEHMIQDLSAAKPWRDVDGPSLVRAAAALQLLPENIQRLVRLQRLAAIGAALPSERVATTL